MAPNAPRTITPRGKTTGRPNLLVLGAGYVGSEFRRCGYEVWDRSRFAVAPSSRLEFDQSINQYDTIVNCIGKSDTRWCERPENWRETLSVNGRLPGLLRDLCNRHGIRLVHISTGCLYDHNDVPQSETNPIASHSRYTLSKWVGENELDVSADLIIRPGRIFNGHDHPKNLLVKLPCFPSYTDEINSFTHTEDVVHAIEALLRAECTGVFNVACDGMMTILDAARLMGLSGPRIDAETLRQREGVHVVDFTMDLAKLKQYYTPKKLTESILSAQGDLSTRSRALHPPTSGLRP